MVEHEYPKARIQDRARLTPILQGSIGFVRKIDEAAACMYALQHEVLEVAGDSGAGRGPAGVSQLRLRASKCASASKLKFKEYAIPVLGIDIGTGGSRAVVVGDDGGVIASATVEHVPFASPGPAWAEQDPADWWRAAQSAVRDVLSLSGVAPKSITAIGLSGQMHGAVLLDEHDEIVRPSIIWCDQRTDEQCEWLTRTIGAARLLELTSNPALTNFTLTKLLWVRQHEPEAWSRVRHVLLPKDYVRLKLSGEYAIDVADASGTLMLDVAKRRWSDEVLAATGISKQVLPAVFESPEVCARVSREAAGLTGLVEGTPIVAGAGDQAAGAVGMGITRPGAVSATIGTSGVVFAATDRPALDPKGRLHTFCHAIPGRWHVMGVTQAAGLSLRWLRDELTGTRPGARRPTTSSPPKRAGCRPDRTASCGRRTSWASGRRIWIRRCAARSSDWAPAIRARMSCVRSSKAWRSACATRSRFSTSSRCRYRDPAGRRRRALAALARDSSGGVRARRRNGDG